MSADTSVIEQRRLWAWPATIVVVAITISLLRSEGRLWMCACGKLSFWAGQVCSANNSQQFLDPFSFTHLLHGFVYACLFWLVMPRLGVAWQFSLAVTLASLWELFENSEFIINRYRTETAALGYHGDTIVNSLGDVTCAAAGFVIARQLGFRRSLILFILVELALLVWIRDSMLLETVMLIHPIGAIKAWQICR
jgi:hypothetical protein